MSDILWPADLPALVQVQNFQDNLPETRIRTQMDAGPVKVRRRYTAGIEKLNVSVRMSRAQVISFMSFFNDTTAGGSLDWDWTHPLTQAATTIMFGDTPPAITAVSQIAFMVSFPIEIQP